MKKQRDSLLEVQSPWMSKQYWTPILPKQHHGQLAGFAHLKEIHVFKRPGRLKRVACKIDATLCFAAESWEHQTAYRHDNHACQKLQTHTHDIYMYMYIYI